MSDGILRCGFCCSFEFKYGIKDRGVGPGPSRRGGGGARTVETDGGLQQEGGEGGGGWGVGKLREEVLGFVTVMPGRGSVPDSDDDVGGISCLRVWSPRSPSYKILAASGGFCDKNWCRVRGRFCVAARVLWTRGGHSHRVFVRGYFQQRICVSLRNVCH